MVGCNNSWNYYNFHGHKYHFQTNKSDIETERKCTNIWSLVISIVVIGITVSSLLGMNPVTKLNSRVDILYWAQFLGYTLGYMLYLYHRLYKLLYHNYNSKLSINIFRYTLDYTLSSTLA